MTQFQRPLPPRRAPLPSFPLFPVFIRSLCFNLSVPLSLFLQLLKKKVCNCFFLFFWRGHGCNLASFFFCFSPQGGYLSHYFCRMEAKLPRTWCNPLRVTTSTGSSLCPTVLQTASPPPPICSLHATVTHHHHHHQQDAGFSPHTVFTSAWKEAQRAPGCNYFGHKCAQKSVNLSAVIEIIAISCCVCLSHNT